LAVLLLTATLLLPALAVHALLGRLQDLAVLLDLLEGCLHGLVVLSALLSLPERLLHFAKLIAKIVQAGSDLRFGHQPVFADAAADPVGVALHVAHQLLLLQVAERFAHLGGSLAFAGLQVARGVLHVLLQLLELGDLLVLGIGQLGLLLTAGVLVVAEGLAHLAFEFLLLAGQILGLTGDVVHLIGGLLPLHARDQILGLLQTIGGALLGRLSLLRSGLHLGVGGAHIVQRLLQLLQGPIEYCGIGILQPLILLLLLLLLLAGLPVGHLRQPLHIGLL